MQEINDSGDQAETQLQREMEYGYIIGLIGRERTI